MIFLCRENISRSEWSQAPLAAGLHLRTDLRLRVQDSDSELSTALMIKNCPLEKGQRKSAKRHKHKKHKKKGKRQKCFWHQFWHSSYKYKSFTLNLCLNLAFICSPCYFCFIRSINRRVCNVSFTIRWHVDSPIYEIHRNNCQKVRPVEVVGFVILELLMSLVRSTQRWTKSSERFAKKIACNNNLKKKWLGRTSSKRIVRNHNFQNLQKIVLRRLFAKKSPEQ